MGGNAFRTSEKSKVCLILKESIKGVNDFLV